MHSAIALLSSLHYRFISPSHPVTFSICWHSCTIRHLDIVLLARFNLHSETMVMHLGYNTACDSHWPMSTTYSTISLLVVILHHISMNLWRKWKWIKFCNTSFEVWINTSPVSHWKIMSPIRNNILSWSSISVFLDWT